MSEKRIINITRWNVRCSNCGYEGITYAYGDHVSYGRLLGRTKSGEIAESNVLEDPILQEVFDLIGNVLPEDKKNFVSCYHHVLSVASDPAPSGEYYDFTGKIKCPNCGSGQVSYGPDDPPIVKKVNIPLVTHIYWQRLNEQEKKKLIEKKLQEVGCL